MKSLVAEQKDIRGELQNISENLSQSITSAISREEKNALVDAIAATGILANLKSPQRLIKLEGNNSYERVLKSDETFTSEAQQMENLSKLYIATEHRNSDAANKVFADSLDFCVPRGELTTKAYEELPQRIRNSKAAALLKSYALDVLSNVSKKIKNEKLIAQIHSLVASYGKYEHTNAEEVCREVSKVSNKDVKTSFGSTIPNPMGPLIAKRTTQILSTLRQRQIVFEQKGFIRN